MLDDAFPGRASCLALPIQFYFATAETLQEKVNASVFADFVMTHRGG